MNQNESVKTGINLGMTIIYVKDQAKSTVFYKIVFGLEPVLEVPGMTQFNLENGAAIGLMPEAGFPEPSCIFR